MSDNIMVYHVLLFMIGFCFVVAFAQSHAHAADTVRDVLGSFHGLTVTAEPDAPLQIITGPLPGIPGIKAEDAAASVEFTPETTVASRGSLMFWLRVEETYRAGPDAEPKHDVILTAPGRFSFETRLRPPFFGIFWIWRGLENANGLRVLVPGIPGPGWYHFAYEWDAEAGIFNAYLNGTPLRLPDTSVDTWNMPALESLQLNLGTYAVANIRLTADLIQPLQLQQEVTQLYRGSLDYLLGSRDLGSAHIDARKGDLIYENPLAQPSDVADWVTEGPAIITFEDGWTKMASERPDGPEGHIVHWCPKDFPDSYIVEWEIQPISRYGLCIVFFSAKGRQGEDIFAPSLEAREGIFPRYHSGDIDCYHISYYANTPNEPGRITTNMRKNHGFYLVTNGPPGIAPRLQDIHTVQLIKDDNHIQLAVDGQVIIDFHDDGQTYGPVLGGGKIGLRQMQWMEAQYRNFRVYEIGN